MARTTKVSATSGQGVSRKAYQTARGLGAKGSGTPGMTPLKNVSTGFDTPGVASGRREYTKGAVNSGGNSAEYSEREMANPNLGHLLKAGQLKPPKAGKGFL
jgi:hypothetical protein